MPLTEKALREAAHRLVAAETTGQMTSDASDGFGELDFEDAYRIQAEIAYLKEAAGAIQVGWKTIGTNPAVRAGRMAEPGRGYLFQSAVVENQVSVPQGRPVFAEPEVSFVLREDMEGWDVTAREILAVTKEVCASIEVAWSRLDTVPSPAALVADNAGAARVVLSRHRVPIDEAGNLATITVEFLKNGEIVQTGAGEEVLGNPANAVAWLANQLSGSGLGLKAGQVILAGSLTVPVPVQPGDVVVARFDRLGEVATRIYLEFPWRPTVSCAGWGRREGRLLQEPTDERATLWKDSAPG